MQKSAIISTILMQITPFMYTIRKICDDLKFVLNLCIFVFNLN